MTKQGECEQARSRSARTSLGGGLSLGGARAAVPQGTATGSRCTPLILLCVLAEGVVGAVTAAWCSLV